MCQLSSVEVLDRSNDVASLKQAFSRRASEDTLNSERLMEVSAALQPEAERRVETVAAQANVHSLVASHQVCQGGCMAVIANSFRVQSVQRCGKYGRSERTLEALLLPKAAAKAR